MKAYEVVGYTDSDGYAYCTNCGSEDMTPIFADTEFDYTVFCAMCGEPLEVNVILERKSLKEFLKAAGRNLKPMRMQTG